MEITDKKRNQILNGKNMMKTMFLLSLPVMFNNILKALHDLVDTVVVAQIDDAPEVVSSQIAAIGFVGPIIMICQALALGIMVAGLALMSQYIGARRDDKAQKVSGQLFLLCIFIGIFFNIVLYVFSPTILRLMNAEGDLYKYSLSYLRIRSFELTGLFIFYAYQATRQAQGDMLSPVIWNVLSIIMNIILTVILVTVVKMNIIGAAIATVVANMALVPICIIHLSRSKTLKLNYQSMKFDTHVIGKVFRLGWPAAVSQAFTSLGFLLINATIAGYNDEILSVITVGNRINSMLLFPAMGVSTVLATFVGQNIGAQNITNARKSFKCALFLSLTISIGGALVVLPCRELLASALLKLPEEIELCKTYLFYLLGGLPLMSIFQCFNGCFQGAGRTDFSLILSTARLWVMRIPIIFLMLYVFDVGEQSVWLCMCISNFGAVILGIILYNFVDFKPRLSRLKRNLEKEKLALANS